MRKRPVLPVSAPSLPKLIGIAVAALTPLCANADERLADLALEDLLRVTISSASRFEQPTTEAPASVTVIDEEELRQHGYRTLAQALSTAPGVYSSSDRSYTYLGVRGFNRPGDYGTRILLLTDGARRNDPLYDQALFGNESPIELDWVKRLEFVSGPASALYGANALFGTANAVMLNGSDINGARVSVDAASFNTRRLGLVAGQRLEGDRDWFMGLASYRSGGENLYISAYDNGTSNGQARGLDGEKYNKLYGKYRWGNWRVSGNYSWREKDDPTANFGTSFGTPGTNQADENRLFELRYDGDTDRSWQPSFRLYHGNYRYSGHYVYAGSPNSRDVAQADWTGTEFRLAYTGLNRHKLLLGVESQWNQQLLQRYFEPTPYNAILDTNNPSRTYSVYLQDEWRIHPDWLLNVGVRHDKHNQFSGVTSPRLALIWQTTNRLTLRAVTGSAYRFPNVFERFYSDNGASQAANPTLRSEYIQTREVSAAYRFGLAGRLGMSLYDNQIHRLIDQTTTTGDITTYLNQPRVDARGVELDGENRWNSGLRLRGSVAWQHSQSEDGTSLVDSPRRMGKLIASLPVGGNWTSSGELLALSGRQGINGPVPGYGIVNLSLLAPADKRYGQFMLSVYNIGNRRYADPAPASMTQSWVEQAGRQIRLRWTLAL